MAKIRTYYICTPGVRINVTFTRATGYHGLTVVGVCQGMAQKAIAYYQLFAQWSNATVKVGRGVDRWVEG